MKKSVFRQMEKKIQQVEADCSLEEFVVASTFSDARHTLKMEDSFSDEACWQLLPVYQELCDLELVDLTDFQKVGANGEFQAW